MTNFTPRPINANGMSLAAYVEGVEMGVLVDRFNEGFMEGYVDDDKGYDGAEVGFVHNETGLELYAYARYGSVRVGCRRHERTDADNIARELAQFLRSSASN